MTIVHPTAYDLIAAEYYEATHKTSRNFDVTTLDALRQHKPHLPTEGLVLEVGCGSGRCATFLKVDSNRIIQLDSSGNMLALNPREPSYLRVHADATCIPMFDGQFSAVVGFLVDPFIGLNFLAEAYRLLVPNGLFFATTPTAEWGHALREQSELEASYATFRTQNGGTVQVPSTLIPENQLVQMLQYSGFRGISVTSHPLPAGTESVSMDIQRVAEVKNVDVYELPIIHLISCYRPNEPD